MSMILRVGDPHVRPDNLAESEKLIDFVAKIAVQRKVDQIEFLGDLFHTHVLVRMDVNQFWIDACVKLGKIAKVILIVGNHDQKGDMQSEIRMNSMASLRYIENITVVDSPKIIGNTTYLPHTADRDKFEFWVREANTPYLVCHQTFDGAEYENGFYSEGGIDVGLMFKFEQVISGHIHKMQRFANIFYPGTPRWDSVSDANEDKAIWLFSEDGGVEKISTKEVCQPLLSYEIHEGGEMPDLNIRGARIHVKLIGSSAWIASTSKSLKESGIRISAKPTDARFSTDTKRLSSIDEYAKDFKFDDGMVAADVIEYIKSL